VRVTEITGLVDTVMVSLSKGLGAPVGSLLCGPQVFIERAVRYRKMIGGGMRQTGWLCACGLAALSEENIYRLAEDHENARILAEGLAELPGFSVAPGKVQTNVVLAEIESPVEQGTAGSPAPELASKLEGRGILVSVAGERTLRFVVSKRVSREDVCVTLKAMRELG
jgi:threonine aldolase